MALAGNWTRTILGANFCVFQGRTANADNDQMILGLDGDAAADVGAGGDPLTTPAGWPTTGETAPTDAELHLRTRVRVIALSDNGIAGPGPGVGFSIEPGSAPWEKTIRLNGTPNAAVTLRVEVEYIHSLIR